MNKIINMTKSVVLNVGVLFIASIVTYLLLKLDSLLGFTSLQGQWGLIIGLVILIIGIIFRIWSSYTFYENKIKVLYLKPQDTFTRDGLYKISRNPLYVGLVAIAFGAVIIAGSISGIIASIFFFVFWDLYIKKVEEKDLEKQFGSNYINYKQSTRRWL